jgi:predicted amidohydrolase YtcJ
MKDILFRNCTVFDGYRFLPAGTWVRVRGGRITGVGPAESLGPLGSAEPVDLDGGTLLPGFIDAHAHPVFAGHQLRHCDLSAASTEPEYLEIVARYAGEHPDEEWITGGGWELPAFPAGIPARQSLDAVVPDRPVYLPNCDGHGAWVNSVALRLAGIDARTPDPPDGRIEREAGGEPAGMLQEGAMALVARLLPEVTDDDNYAALLAAQAHLLSLGITGWQDAIIGRMPGEIDATGAYLRADRAGTLRVNVVGAQWWDRDQGLEQLPELLHRRVTAGRFRATSVKMMLDGVAENHTAALLEPYLGGDGCPVVITWPTCRSCTPRTSVASPGSARPRTSSRCGRRTSRRWTSSPSRSSASAGQAGSIRSARCTPRARPCARAATGR